MKMFIFILIATSITSCRKSPSCNGSYSERPQQFLQYWYFGEGSYWIYKSSNGALIDTVRVTKRYSDNTDVTDKYDGSPEAVCAKNYYLDLSHSYYACSESPLIDRMSSVLGYNQINFDCSCPFYLVPQEVFQLANFQGKTVKINDMVYTDVWSTVSMSFAPNIGRIEAVYSDSIQWQLVDYHIVN